MLRRFLPASMVCTGAFAAAGPVSTPAAPPKVAATLSVAATPVSVLTASEVVQILDQTSEWYRTLGMLQQNASQPSDVLILYANRQIADKVVELATARARP